MSKITSSLSPSPRPPVWEPSRNAIHRLIQIMDVLAGSLQRFQQLSLQFSLPESASPKERVANRNSYLPELRDDYQRVLLRVFPPCDGEPDLIATELVLAANVVVFEHYGDEVKCYIRRAADWLRHIVSFYTPQTAECFTVDDRRKFDFCEQLLSAWSAIRKGLFLVLEGNRFIFPIAIKRRHIRILNPAMPLITVDELLGLVDQTTEGTTVAVQGEMIDSSGIAPTGTSSANPDTLPSDSNTFKAIEQTASILPVLLCASDIAKRIQQNVKSVTSFLTRFAVKKPDCRVANDSKRKNEPEYLYRTADVWPALQAWKSSNPKD